MDFGTKVFAQTFIGVRYGSSVFLPDHSESPIFFAGFMVVILVILSILKTILLKEERVVEIAQTLFFAGVCGTYLDSFFYPGNPKWLWKLNLTDVYFSSALVIILFLFKQIFLKFKRSRR